MNNDSRYLLSKLEGVPKGKVLVSPFQTEWLEVFEHERIYLSELLAIPPSCIYHFGSTSIPGCDAKPIIDIAIPFSSVRATQKYRWILSKTEYAQNPVYYLVDRICYTKGEPQQFHLYLINENSSTFINWIVFKEALTNDPSLKAIYCALKRKLAEEFADQRVKYTEAKTDFIYQILNQDERWRTKVLQMTV